MLMQGSIRELTPAEWKLISGGYDPNNNNLGDVTITWSPDPTPPDPFYGFNDDGGGGGSSGGGGLGDGEHITECTPTTHDAIHADSNYLASLVAKDILAHSNNSTQEYVTAIYKDAEGHLHTMPLQTSSETSKANLTFNGITGDQIVGLIHNHPSGIYEPGSSLGDINRLPSPPNKGGDDWLTADYLVQHGADPNNLTLYILGPDSVLREYAYTDEYKWEHATPTTRPGTTVPSDLADPCATAGTTP